MNRQRKIVNSNIWQLLAEFCNKASGTQKISLFNYTIPSCSRSEFKNFVGQFYAEITIRHIPQFILRNCRFEAIPH